MDFVGLKAAIISLYAKLQDMTAGRVHILQRMPLIPFSFNSPY